MLELQGRCPGSAGCRSQSSASVVSAATSAGNAASSSNVDGPQALQKPQMASLHRADLDGLHAGRTLASSAKQQRSAATASSETLMSTETALMGLSSAIVGIGGVGSITGQTNFTGSAEAANVGIEVQRLMPMPRSVLMASIDIDVCLCCTAT